MTEKRQHFDPELLNVVSYKNDLMDYLKSLSHLNGKMSKDATSYANLSSIVKRRLASFKVGLFWIFFRIMLLLQSLVYFATKNLYKELQDKYCSVVWRDNFEIILEFIALHFEVDL